MELTTLYKQYRAAKLAADQAAKEEDKLKKALKKAMEEAGVKNYTDEDGFLFERIVQNRKSMDEKGVLESLKEKGLTQCIKTVEAVDEAKVYNLRSSNKYLTVSSLGVQFMAGKYTTTDPAVARALLEIDDVELIED